jgi:hypothetical protein
MSDTNFDHPVIRKYLAAIDELALIAAQEHLNGHRAAHKATRDRLNRTSDVLGAILT